MLVLPFPGKQTFARVPRLVADFTIAPDAPGDRLAVPRVLDASIQPAMSENHPR
jgi:hypothetical protein